ncbi:MAG TPA: hypothetical protein VN213_18840, partial [Solirubrobacteraceae bacterium]|nr:hypothetical protein [Solirubrobacteraceae bacterium]
MRGLAPPTGQAPPADLVLRDGTTVDVAGLAATASDRHLARHPEEIERHGPYTRDWCRHDLQWVLSWAALDADRGAVDLLAQLDWLARVLSARGYPLASLAEALETLADVAEEELPAA